MEALTAANKKTEVKNGLFERVYSLFKVLPRLPERMTEDEIEGLVKVLPANIGNTFRILLNPTIQEASLASFNLLYKWMNEAKEAKKAGKKVVLVPFNFYPELIHSFENLFPVTSEVLSTIGTLTLDGQADRYWEYAMGLGLPDDLCSANTIEVGSVLSGMDFEPDAIISAAPGACDLNAKIHEFLAVYLDIPQFVVEKPPDNSQHGLSQFKKSYYRLIAELEEFAGEKLKEERLREVAEKSNRCTELYYDLWELKKAVPCPVPAVFSALILGVRFAMWGRDESVEVLEKMIKVSRQIMESEEYKSRKEVARVFWTYLSYYYDVAALCEWMEQKGVANLGDMVQIHFTQALDLTSTESIIDGIVENSWNAFMTRQMGGSSMFVTWVDDLTYVIKELKIDGAVFCGHHSCKQTWSVFSATRKEILNRTGVPTLGLHGDCWISSITPMSIIKEEVEQFLDNVLLSKQERRKRKKA